MTDPKYASLYQDIGSKDLRKMYSQGSRKDSRMNPFYMQRDHTGMDDENESRKKRVILIDETNSKYLTVQDDLDSDIE